MPISFIKIAVGILLLCMGRRLFWLFVAAVGFVIAGQMAEVLLAHEPQLVRLLVAAFVGLLGALVAIYVQKLAITLAGFLAGGYILMTLLDASTLHCPGWISFAIGGLIGAILMIVVFNWTLMVFSSATGAHLIVPALHLHHTMASIIFVVLCVLGVLIQARLSGSPARSK